MTLCFSDRRHGWLVGDPITTARGSFFGMWATRDGGEHWQRAAGCPARPGEALFAASNGSLLLARGTASFVTGGTGGSRRVQWNCRAHPLPFVPGASAGAFAIAQGAGGLILVGGDYREPGASVGSAFRSSDGGRTWAAPAVPPAGYRSGVAFAAGVWFAVGTSGAERSNDGGKTWMPLNDGKWNAVAPPYLVGPEGRIGKVD